MKPVSVSMLPAVAAVTLFMSGCASVAQTSNAASVEPKCKVVMAQSGRINYDPARTTPSEKIEARAKLAAIDLNLPASRNTSSGFYGAIDQALRDCP